MLRAGRGVRWLDEGEAASAEIREWQQERTFCFMENATLRVRLDPLNRFVRLGDVASVTRNKVPNSALSMAGVLV